MATFVLIPGAGSGPWLWHLVVPELQARGHETIAIDLPCEDPEAGLQEYVQATIDQVGDSTELVVVAQSLGGFTGSLACAELPARLLVMVAPMTPAPGETPGEWWDNTAYTEAVRELTELIGPARSWGPNELAYAFLNGVDPEIAEQVGEHGRDECSRIFETPWTLDAWPDVPTRVLIATEDRFFPPEFQRRVTRERLGITPDEMPGCHVPMLSDPVELADRLVGYYEAL